MGNKTGWLVGAAVAIEAACGLAATPAAAGQVFDFEDGTLQGWRPTQTGGAGATGVELQPALTDLAAFAKHTGGWTTQLSYDFAFVPGETVAFDMLAIANPGGDNVPSYAGVTISFLNGLNVSEGSMSLLNTTGSLGAHQFLVDVAPHHYESTMAGFAGYAGLASTSTVSTLNVTFAAWGNDDFWGPSSAAVWVDNVQVGAVPEPDARLLLLLGLGVPWIAARRARHD